MLATKQLVEQHVDNVDERLLAGGRSVTGIAFLPLVELRDAGRLRRRCS
jgi:hypothetical protein